MDLTIVDTTVPVQSLATGFTDGHGDVKFGGMTLRSTPLYPDAIGPVINVNIAGATGMSIIYEVKTTVQYNK